MKNNFLQEAYGGLREARSKHYCLGLPRKWKVMTSTLLLLFTFAIGNVWAYTYNHATSVPEWTANFDTWSGASDAATKTEATVHNPRLYWNSTKWDNLSSAQSVAFDGDGFYYMYQPGTARQLPTGTALDDMCFVVAVAQESYFKYNNTSSTISSPATTINGLTTNSGQTSSVGYQFIMPRAGYVRVLMGTDSNSDPTGTANDEWKNATLTGATTGTVAVTYLASGTTYDVKTRTSATTFSTTTYTSAGKKLKSVEFAVNAGITNLVVNPAKLSNNSTTNRKMFIYAVEVYMESAAKYSVTYKAGEGSGADVVDSDAKTVKAFADCSFTAPTGYEFKEWQDAGSNVIAAGATVSSDMTLTAIYRLIPTKYTVTYDLGGAPGDAPTSPDKAEGDEVTLASDPSWAGHAFDGWEVKEATSGDEVSVSAGKFTMPDDAVNITAQWHELECKIYSFTGGIGSATAQTANATVDAEKMFVKDSGDKIRLTPATGESFKVGDILTFSGNLNNSAKKFGLKLYADGGSSVSQTIENAAGTVPMICSAALTFNADYIDFARADGTGTTVYTCEIHRACAEGVAAGLSYAETSVGKYSSDAAFTNPLTNANNLVVVYGSSDNAVATIDANGQVTIVGMGTATITAKSAVQTKSGTLYAAGTASYTLTVAAPPTFAVTYANNGGDGTMTDSNSPYAEGAEVTLLDNTFTAPSGYAWSAWAVTETVSGNPVAVSEGKFTMPGVAVTVTAQWQLIADFDVKFFQGYGDPDAQIGETQSISTGNYATAPTDPTRPGFAFLGWSYDATEAHIVDVAAYGITAATNFTAMWKQVWIVTFDGAGNVIVEDGEAVASPNSPTQAGKIFQGWYNGESKYDFSAAVTGNLALTSKWADADANHFYYTYNDDFHFDGVVYKTPEGKIDEGNGDETMNLTNPYNIFSGTAGITSIVANNAQYDSKHNYVNAYLKLKTEAFSNLVFTIASGYTAVLKMKMGAYSKDDIVVTLKNSSDEPVTPASGTVSGHANEENNFGEVTYNLVAGVYTLTTATRTLYVSHIDLEATALPAHTVTYKAGEGTGDDVEDTDATEVADVPGTFTAPTGKIFNGWKDGDNNDVEVGTIVTGDMTLTAQWINHYAVTFNMNDYGDAIDPQDIKEGAKATRPADPVAIGFDFGGWFTDNGTFEAPFDFNTPITAATPLYAKWTADPCPTPFSLSKVVLTSASDGTVTGYNGNEYAGEAVIGGLKDDDNTAEVDPSHEGVEEGYKLNGGGSGIVFATLKKGNFQEGDRVIVTITAKQNSYKIEEVSQDVLHIYYGTNASDATKLTTLESVSTAGSYTYRLKAADITAIGTKKGIGVFRESSNGQNPYVYSVEIKGCRSFAVMHTLTFKNIDGTATIAAEPLEEGVYASTVAPAAPKITLKRFLGWAEAVDGTPVDLTAYTITEDKTLYAVYEDIVCPTKGKVFSMEFDATKTPAETVKVAKNGGTLDAADYATISGGSAQFINTETSDKDAITTDGKFKLAATKEVLKIELECALQEGDIIRVLDNSNKYVISTSNSKTGTYKSQTSSEHEYAVTDAWTGVYDIYLLYDGSGWTFTKVEIYRPAKYDVSFNMMGHGSAIADLEDVIEGSKIAAPSPAPTDEDYSFAGWYKENTLANEWKFDVDVVEANTTLYAKWLDKSDATLKSLKYGETDIVLVVDQYTYNITLPSLTSSVPALTAETNNPNATKAFINGTFDGEGNATSTVTVTPEAGADKVYTVNFARGIALEQVTVTTSMEWDWSAAGVTAEINNTNTPGLSGNDVVIANVPGVNNDADFNSQALKASGTNAIRTTYFQGKELNIKTNKEGMLIVDFSGTNNKARVLKVYDNADTEIAAWNYNSDARQVQQVIVPAGNVTLKAFEGENGNNARIYNLKFYALAYTRDDEWMAPGELGTICYPEGLVAVGADMYEMDGVDDNNKFVFDEVTVTQPGVPYLFEAQANVLKFYATTATAADAAGTSNGMVGTFASIDLSHTDARAAKWYYFSGTKFYAVNKRTTDLNVPANRAYVDLNESHPAGAPKQGVRRLTFNVDSMNAATGMDELNASETPVKMLIDGQLFILRGEKMYNANGQLVK